MKITTDQIERVAPDQASLNAAHKLLKPALWPQLEMSADDELLWGQCLGSGATPYNVAVAGADLGVQCTCPSRKFPCKHGIALMWWFASDSDRFATAAVPDWVSGWISRRRGGSAPSAGTGGRASASLASASEPSDKPRSHQAVRQGTRIAAQREASVLEGITELDTWINDQLEQGLAGFSSRATTHCGKAAKRLVDAKAPALAATLERRAAEIMGAPVSERASRAIEALGLVYLLGAAHRAEAELSPGLRADVRHAIGWTTSKEGLFEDPAALRHRGRWRVLSVRRELQVDKLVRIETWLAEHAAGPGRGRDALLLDFLPAAVAQQAGASQAALAPGADVDAELVYYPSETPLRALIGELRPLPTPEDGTPGADWPVAGSPLHEELARFHAALACNPWLPPWPLAVCDAVIRYDKEGAAWLVAERIALPVGRDFHDSAKALHGLDPITMHALFDGRALSPVAVSTPLGPWWPQ